MVQNVTKEDVIDFIQKKGGEYEWKTKEGNRFEVWVSDGKVHYKPEERKEQKIYSGQLEEIVDVINKQGREVSLSKIRDKVTFNKGTSYVPIIIKELIEKRRSLTAGEFFEVGQIYDRREDLHGRFGGQEQGGISTPADYPVIFLFTGETGAKYGYTDEFREDGTFWYTGEGQVGDMSMTRGNQAIRDHESDGKELHLFEALGDGEVRYLGQAFYLTHHLEERRDVNGNLRQAIVFELALETGEVEEEAGEVGESSINYDSDTSLKDRSMDELKQIAIQAASPTATAEERRTNAYYRAEAVKEYVLRRADGVCEGCGQDAPFVTTQRRPYLEAHHVRRLTDGGPDHPRWVVALCPNCHMRVHYGLNGEEYNEWLAERLGEIEVVEDG